MDDPPSLVQDRAVVADLVGRVQQEEMGDQVTLAYVDQDYTGEQTADDAKEHGIALEVVKLPDAKHCFVPLPRRWVVERDFAWVSHFRRQARDYERLPETLAGLHLTAFVILMSQRLSALNSS